MCNVVFCLFEEEEMLRTLVIVLQSVILFDALESSSTLNQLLFEVEILLHKADELSFILPCLLGLELHVSL